MEREVLGNLSAVVSEALINRAQSVKKDPLAEMTGIPGGHKEAPEDPAMARLLPDFEMEGDEEYEGDNSLLRSFHEHDITRAKIQNLQVINSALGPDGNVAVNASEEEAQPGWRDSMTSGSTWFPGIAAVGRLRRRTVRTWSSGWPTPRNPCWKR